MKKKLTLILESRFTLLLMLSVTMAIMSCGKSIQKEVEALPYFVEETFTPHWSSDDEKWDNGHAIADFTFVNQNGKTIDKGTVDGKVYIANFFFSICPTVCPKMTKNLVTVQERYDSSQVLILSHTVMPWVDDVEQLKKYARLNQIDGRQWHLLTGEKSKIYALARQSYFADEGFGKTVTDESDFLHTEKLILIDANSRIRGVYNGTLPLETARMIEDIEILINESKVSS